MMSRKLLLGLPALILAAGLGIALFSSDTAWGRLTAIQSDSVFCSSGPSPATLSASASRILPPCPPAAIRS